MLLFIVLALGSCTKVLVGPGGTPITGSWVLTETSQRTGSGWQYISTGLENGVFDFYNSGAAEYNDGYVTMQGNWSTRYTSGGYYDRYGDYYSGSHTLFEIHLRDRYSGSNVNLYFDEVIISGNTMIATYYDGRYVSRYVFNRF